MSVLDAIKRLFKRREMQDDALISLGYMKTSTGMICGDRHMSPQGCFSAVLQRDTTCEGRHVPGGVWLFEGNTERLAITDLKIPWRCAVSDTGRLIVADAVSRESLSCWVRIFESDGTVLYSQRHRRNLGGVGISPEGGIAVYGTANPNAVLRVVDVSAGLVLVSLPGNGFFGHAAIDEATRTVHLDMQYPDQARFVTYGTNGTRGENE